MLNKISKIGKKFIFVNKQYFDKKSVIIMLDFNDFVVI